MDGCSKYGPSRQAVETLFNVSREAADMLTCHKPSECCQSECATTLTFRVPSVAEDVWVRVTPITCPVQEGSSFDITKRPIC